jgi:hypothetical protein
MRNRLVVFVASCLPLGLRMCPQIETDYSSGNNQEIVGFLSTPFTIGIS